MVRFIAGNRLSAVATNLGTLAVARFVSGMQGAYFGAGAVVASYIMGPGRGGKAFALVMTGLTVATIIGSQLATSLGQHLGWRNTYIAVLGAGVLALLAHWAWVPRTDALRGGTVTHELGALRRPAIWVMMTVAALGVSSIFAVYTFIGPFVTDSASLSPALIPVALALFGIGMTASNLIGGRIADTHASRGLVLGSGFVLLVLAILALGGEHPWVLMLALFGVGLTMMIAIPTIQVSLTRVAPEAPTLMGAMNLAALNVANALGAWTGGLAIGAGFGLLSAPWTGFGLTLASLLIFAVAVRLRARITACSPPWSHSYIFRRRRARSSGCASGRRLR